MLWDVISSLFPHVSWKFNLPTIQADPDEILEVPTEDILEAVKKIIKEKKQKSYGISNKARVMVVNLSEKVEATITSANSKINYAFWRSFVLKAYKPIKRHQ